MKESTAAWFPLRKVFVESHLFFQRMETRYAEGVPDVYWTSGGRSGWVELKWDPSPPVPGPRSKHWVMDTLRGSQVAWLWRHGRAGGRGGILCRASDHWLYWAPEKDPTWVEQMLTDPLAADPIRWTATSDLSFSDWVWQTILR